MVIATRTLKSGFPQSNEGPLADCTHAVTENEITTPTNFAAARYRGGEEQEISAGMRVAASVCSHSAGSREDIGVSVLLSSLSSCLSAVKFKRSPI